MAKPHLQNQQNRLPPQSPCWQNTPPHFLGHRRQQLLQTQLQYRQSQLETRRNAIQISVHKLVLGQEILQDRSAPRGN